MWIQDKHVPVPLCWLGAPNIKKNAVISIHVLNAKKNTGLRRWNETSEKTNHIQILRRAHGQIKGADRTQENQLIAMPERVQEVKYANY